MKVIVIDDEKSKRITMCDALKKAGYDSESFESPIAAMNYFEQYGADILITDIRMTGMDGFDVLQKVKSLNQRTSVIMITAYGTIQSAVEAMKMGAYDYITKPFSSDHLVHLVNKLAMYKKLEEENLNLKRKLQERYSFHNLIGKSKVMQELYDQLDTISKTDMAVLIEGESGTGKEVVANAIHYNSNRKDKPFIKLSCAVLNESILESELFGHVKGAFTGAYKDKKGRFESANEGTLFLDDVDDIPLSFQVKLLRVLQEKEFERVGGNTPIKVNVRIICASKIDLWEKVQRNEFREDLYYRIRVIPIRLPALRERKEDIPLLIDHFIKKIGREEVKFSPDSIEVLSEMDWHGNVRQLENAVNRIVAFSGSNLIKKEMIPEDILCKKEKHLPLSFNGYDSICLEKIVEELEASAVIWALQKAGGNQSKAAKFLNIKRTTFRDKMLKYKISEKS
jgi:DNA-binding NtrC family response regulator